MKRKVLVLMAWVIVCFSCFHFSSFSHASGKALSFEMFLNIYVQATTKNIAPQYDEVVPKYQDIDKNSILYDTLQRAIYLEIIPNLDVQMDFSVLVKQSFVAKMLAPQLWEVPEYSDADVDLLWTIWLIRQRLDYQKTSDVLNVSNATAQQEKEILAMIAETLKNNYISPKEIPDYRKYSTISWFLTDLGDPYTQYFDPVQAKEFQAMLNLSLIGIGVYLEHSDDGKFLINRVVAGWWAEEAGVKAWDEIIQIEDIHITSSTPFEKVTSLLRGEEWTQVTITVKRNYQPYTFTITRKKITLPAVTSKVLEDDICYIDMVMFSLKSDKDFDRSLANLEDSQCSAYAFDLRANGWGSLDAALHMLWYFVDHSEPTFYMQDKTSTKAYYVPGSRYPYYFKKYFEGKPMFFLIDKNTASASEVFVGIIKAYHPEVKIVGKQSFGKWTAQQLELYAHWGMLKYTIAKWLIWKNKTFVWGVGITPDIEMSDDPKTEQDEVIEWVKDNN